MIEASLCPIDDSNLLIGLALGMLTIAPPDTTRAHSHFPREEKAERNDGPDWLLF